MARGMQDWGNVGRDDEEVECEVEDWGYSNFDMPTLEDYDTPVPPKVLVPMKPPAPRHLADAAAFIGPNAPAWTQIPQRSGTDFYQLNDPTTNQLALFTMDARIAQTGGIPTFMRSPSISGKNISFILESPGPPGSTEDVVYRACVDQLEKQKRRFEDAFPTAAATQETYGSFVKWSKGGAASTVKIQQPLAKRESHFFKLNTDPFYAHVCKHGNIPDDCKSIQIPIHSIAKTTDKATTTSTPNAHSASTSTSKTAPKPQTVKTIHTFDINTILASDFEGELIRPKDLKARLTGRRVRVIFCICHTRPQGDNTPRVFIARPLEIRLLEPDVQKSNAKGKAAVKGKGKAATKAKGTKKQGGTSAPSKAGKSAVEPTQDTGSEYQDKVGGIPKPKGKRRADDNDDNDYQELPKAKGKRKAVGEGPSTRQVKTGRK